MGKFYHLTLQLGNGNLNFFCNPDCFCNLTLKIRWGQTPIVDVRSAVSGQELRQPIEYAGLASGDGLLAGQVGPIGWGHHQEVSLGASIEKLAAWFVERAEALVLERDDRMTGGKGSSGDFLIARLTCKTKCK